MKQRHIMRQLPIDRIKVGTRHRADMGDIEALASSIKQLTLLHPVVVTPTRQLVAGQRRLEACRSLGWTHVPAVEISGMEDALSILRAERDENTCRKDMVPSEAVALGRALEKLERPKALERKAATQAKPGDRVGAGHIPAPRTRGDVRDIVGPAVGMSGSRYHRAKRVVEAAESGDPVALSAQENMDRTGQVSPAYDAIRAVSSTPSRRGLINGRDRVGNRTVKQAVASLRQAAENVDSAAAGFEMDAFGDLSLLVERQEAQEWLVLLLDATQRLGAHVRTLRRYQKGVAS